MSSMSRRRCVEAFSSSAIRTGEATQSSPNWNKPAKRASCQPKSQYSSSNVFGKESYQHLIPLRRATSNGGSVWSDEGFLEERITARGEPYFRWAPTPHLYTDLRKAHFGGRLE